VNIVIESNFAIALVLIGLRIGGVLIATPLFAVGGIPVRVRVLFTLLLAGVLVAARPGSIPAGTLTVDWIVQAALVELFTGALLAFGVSAAFAAFQFGGRTLDFQLGFGVASVIDPATQQQAPLLGSALNLMAVTIFFLLDGHHVLVRGLAHSVAILPPGSFVGGDGARLVVEHFGVLFAYGVAIVAPPMITVLLVDTAMAVAARTMPQVNMFILAIPIKIVVGISLLALSLEYVEPLLERLFRSIFVYWDELIA